MNIPKLITAAAIAILPLAAGAQTKFERGLLIELYTGQGCANCPPQATALKELVANESDPDRLIWVTHHYGYNSDSLSIEASEAPGRLCGISGAPHVIYNRTLTMLGRGVPCLSQSGTTLRDYNEHLRSTQGKSFIRQEMEAGADISIDIDLAYDEASRGLQVRVYGQKNEDFAAGNPTLTAYLVERSWTGFQAMGYQGPGIPTIDYAYHHMNPVRALISSAPLGDAVTFDDDGHYEMTYDLTVPVTVPNYPYDTAVGQVETEVNPDSLYVVAFVANIDETPVDNINYDRDNIRVYNAAKCDLGDNSTTGIDTRHATTGPAVTADGGRITVDGEDHGFDIYSLSGQAMANGSLGRGIYIVRFTHDGRPVCRKVIVK